MSDEKQIAETNAACPVCHGIEDLNIITLAAALATLPINPSDEALIDAFMAERARAGKIRKLGTKKKR